MIGIAVDLRTLVELGSLFIRRLFQNTTQYICCPRNVLGVMSIFMLPQITSNRRYIWVGGFLCELIDVISWQLMSKVGSIFQDIDYGKIYRTIQQSYRPMELRYQFYTVT